MRRAELRSSPAGTELAVIVVPGHVYLQKIIQNVKSVISYFLPIYKLFVFSYMQNLNSVNSVACLFFRLANYIYTNCVISYFLPIFNTLCMCRKIRCDKEFEIFSKIFGEVNKALVPI